MDEQIFYFEIDTPILPHSLGWQPWLPGPNQPPHPIDFGAQGIADIDLHPGSTTAGRWTLPTRPGVVWDQGFTHQIRGHVDYADGTNSLADHNLDITFYIVNLTNVADPLDTTQVLMTHIDEDAQWEYDNITSMNMMSFNTSGGGSFFPIFFANFRSEHTAAPCFCHGTQILTDRGTVLVQDLEIGDMVKTMDHGFQPIRWIGSRIINAKGKFAPIRISAGAMGNSTDLRVSPQHRMYVAGASVELVVGESEALVPAINLVNGSTIRRDPCEEVEYFHLMFDKHEVIFANGAAAESFLPGPLALSGLTRESVNEIRILFPSLTNDAMSYGPSARLSIKAQEASLISAHI